MTAVRLTHVNGATVTVDAEKAKRLIAEGNFSASSRTAAAAPAKKAAKRKAPAKKAAPPAEAPTGSPDE